MWARLTVCVKCDSALFSKTDVTRSHTREVMSSKLLPNSKFLKQSLVLYQRNVNIVSVCPSARVEAGQRRVLDEATRQRRLTRQLEALEKDNFQVSPSKRGHKVHM